MAGHNPPISATATEPVSWTSMAAATFCSGFRSASRVAGPPGAAPPSRTRRRPGPGPSRAAVDGPVPRPPRGWETMWTSMSPGIADYPGAYSAAEEVPDQAGELLVPGDADDDLGGVDAAGEVQQGGGRILPGHDVVAAAQVQDQPALGLERLGRFRGDAVGGADVDRQQVPAVDPVEDAGPAADQDFALPGRRSARRRSAPGPASCPSMPCSARYLARPSSTRSASHSKASSRSAVRLPSRK